MAHLAWVIQKEMLYQCMALHPVLQVNKIMAIGQSGGGGSLSMGHSGGSGLSGVGGSLSMYGSSGGIQCCR